MTAERFDPEEAHRIGLLNGVVADQGELDEMEEKLKKAMFLCSPDAMSASKDLIAQLEANQLTMNWWTAGRLADVRDSEDGQEGMGAFLERRKPRWLTSE